MGRAQDIVKHVFLLWQEYIFAGKSCWEIKADLSFKG